MSILKRILFTFFILLCACCIINIKADSTNNVTIDYCTLAFEDNIYILYAVKTSNEETPELMVWTNGDGIYDDSDAITLTYFQKDYE